MHSPAEARSNRPYKRLHSSLRRTATNLPRSPRSGRAGLMDRVMGDMVYFGAMAFERTEGGMTACKPREARSEIAARCLAAAMAAIRSGAVAFSRTSDSASCEVGTAEIIARYGEVP